MAHNLIPAGQTDLGTINYAGRIFRSAKNPGLTGHYHQDGDLVWAEFSGGTVSLGRLVGHRAEDGRLELAYSYRLTDGGLVTGRCTSRPELLPDGRVRLTEHFRRLDGATGVSVIEEAPQPNLPRPLLADSDDDAWSREVR